MNMSSNPGNLREMIERHVAGQTIKHESPFSSLPTYKNQEEISREFIQKWVVPFYMKIWSLDQEFENGVVAIIEDISDDVISMCLGDFNWRTRQTGAFFAGITNSTNFIDVIGVHLLKSEVCYAGRIYATVLAYFNTDKCVEYLECYLEYYLSRLDLVFDQIEVMAALQYVNAMNGKEMPQPILDLWGIYSKANQSMMVYDRIKDEMGRKIQAIGRIASSKRR